ncbi:MAG: SBBP repeat-containing protein [Deltaproteobacteria bacterium]|nr:SBBP repeat-containing protein [Deltaproteobacteria bacterium]
MSLRRASLFLAVVALSGLPLFGCRALADYPFADLSSAGDGRPVDDAVSHDGGPTNDGNLDATGDAQDSLDLVELGLITDGGEAIPFDTIAHDAIAPDTAPPPSLPWLKTFGSTGSDQGYGVATDSFGNVYVTGGFSGAVSFGGTSVISAGSSDLFVTSFTSAGTPRWTQGFGSAWWERGHGVAVDGAGTVTMTGFFGGTITTLGSPALQAAGGQDILVASFTSSGTPHWHHAFGGNDAEGDTLRDWGNAVAVDAKGNVYVTGSFHGNNATLAPGLTVSSKGSTDIVVASFTSTGAPRWQKALGGTGEDVGLGIAVDAKSNVYVTGTFQNKADLGGGPATATAPNPKDGFITSFTTTGTYRWQRVLKGTESSVGQAIAADGAGDVYVTGSFGGTADFGTPAVLLPSNGSQDVFVAKFGGVSGNLIWQKALGGSGYDVGRGITVGPTGKIYVTGIFSGTADLSGDKIAGATKMAQDKDVFVSCFSDKGAFRWQETLNGPGEDWGEAVAVSPGGDVYVAGRFWDTFSYKGTTYRASSKDKADIFLWKIVP